MDVCAHNKDGETGLKSSLAFARNQNLNKPSSFVSQFAFVLATARIIGKNRPLICFIAGSTTSTDVNL